MYVNSSTFEGLLQGGQGSSSMAIMHIDADIHLHSMFPNDMSMQQGCAPVRYPIYTLTGMTLFLFREFACSLALCQSQPIEGAEWHIPNIERPVLAWACSAMWGASGQGLETLYALLHLLHPLFLVDE